MAQPDGVVPMLPLQTGAPNTSVQVAAVATQLLHEHDPLHVRVPAQPAPVVQLVGTPGLSQRQAL
jgi:hypothetical protein